jgi:hypothetical protein
VGVGDLPDDHLLSRGHSHEPPGLTKSIRANWVAANPR